MPSAVLRSELLKTRLDRFTRMLHGVEHGEMRSIHRARVESRRLRELVPVIRLDPADTKKLGKRLRRVTGRLGSVRELDVLLALIDELLQSRPRLARGLQRVGVVVSKTRDGARKRLFEHLPMDQMWRIARKLDRIVGELREDEERARLRTVPTVRAVRWAVEARAAHRGGRLQAAIRVAGAVYLPERLHAVRIALKKLRYALELSAELAGHRKTTPVLRALRRGQDVLGRMHDLQVLIDQVREVQASLSPPSVTAWRELDALVVALEDDCRRLHARYVRDRDALTSIANRLVARAPIPAQGRRAG
jgi:CHAD domain-containing protein